MSDQTNVILGAFGRLGLEIGSQIATLGSELGARLDQIDGRMGQIEARQDQLDGRMGQLDTRLDHLAARLDRSEAVHIQTRTELMARMDRLQDAMTDMRNDVLVNFGMVEQVQRAHDSTREELKTVNEMVILLVKRIRVLEADMRTLKGET